MNLIFHLLGYALLIVPITYAIYEIMKDHKRQPTQDEIDDWAKENIR